jgi:NAD+ synthetase
VVAPETALTGYFLEGGVRDLAVTGDQLFADLSRQHREAGTPPVDVALGFYEVNGNRHYNSGMYATLGGLDAGIRHIHRKIFLPTYGVFDEERFVEAGRSVQAFDTRWGRAAILICEDAWHSFTPMLAALDGAQLIIIPSASPARGVVTSDDTAGRPVSLARWSRLAQDIAGEHGVYVALSQLVGFEGGKAFPGGSILAGPRGDLLAQGPVFQEAIIPGVLDFEEITRSDLPLLADLEMRLPHLLGSLHAARREKAVGARRASPGEPSPGSLDPASLPSDVPERPHHVRATRASPLRNALPPLAARFNPEQDPLAIDVELTQQWLREFIRDEVQRRRKFDKVVIGLSGGVDSSLVAYLAVEALGAANVLGVRMPYRSSSPGSLAHAQLVIDALGIPGTTVDISPAVDALAETIEGASPERSERMEPARLGNIMARTRMITLFDLSAAHRALPLGTGNKTERLLGYFTWHADDSPPVNPIGDLFKTQVWALARHLRVPDVIVSKPASADLIKGQTDEGDFGISYPRADAILHWILLGYRAPEISALGFDEAEIALVRKRLDSTHWKRRLPTVAMLSGTAIGEYYLRPVDY